MSLYRFKSRETGDLVMLQPHGKRILEILGKDPSGPGIVQPDQMAAAVRALQDAIVAEEADHKRLKEEAAAQGEVPPEFETVSLRMRSAPFIEMLKRCEQAKVDIVWGV
ncbi:MAG: DUF1840 domain-containing protein [Hydrogenophaga sp.]|jgi:hypothetical protein|uniref:DUF1840 domain-containing protein n=1 Tax=Hydrogenophaga TaxID=47420 RepID=UPI0008CC5B61|nr:MULTISPECIES: DUF1840 domain-containing protein [Hydrogenophaga]OGB29071.1 MAG: hypothetical protein A3I16_01090 [Burkholderiales bacterium RIFCSPLOWO2_02_FULL_66_35]MDO9030424.1 DUF1840 domain-containing protein [Hydrogenophaga sp.]MDO9291642.1 DUF1840 domain-containing protein [Hydrogenophaga sp.]MDP2020900.1 DUF1840 domain-containing protein [Hydrogenophaga sp.]UCU93777.1 DUF1840 domain-containing protein [Hydrogenophaga taeniospiralis]